MAISYDNQFEEAKMPFVVALCSGKGGVGKSVLTANLAQALSEIGLSVLIWDANSRFPNQHLLFGVEPSLRLSEVYAGRISVSNAIYPISEKLHLLADTAATVNGKDSDNIQILDLYLQLLNETDFDVILLDTAGADSDETLHCCNIADMISIVVNDEPTALVDAYAFIKIVSQFINSEKMKLLVNNVIDNEDAEDISEKLNLATEKFLDIQLDVLGYIPYDRAIRQSILHQELFLMNNTGSEASTAIREIAGNIASKILVSELR
jgi:flagellar biosynthesis protein FlhG